jgi:hypothetical protein
VIDRRAARAAGRRLVGPEEDQHVGKLDDLRVVRADGDGGPAKGIDEEFLLRGQVLNGMNSSDPPADYIRKRSTDKEEQADSLLLSQDARSCPIRFYGQSSCPFYSLILRATC